MKISLAIIILFNHVKIPLALFSSQSTVFSVSLNQWGCEFFSIPTMKNLNCVPLILL